MTEEWRPAVGFEGQYEVSSLGRVRSLDRVLTSQNVKRGYPRRVRGKMLELQRNVAGYAQVSFNPSVKLVHTLVATAFLGPRPPGLEICHGDGDKTNNSVQNLRYDTHLSNCVDRKNHGGCVEGEKNPRAKLTVYEVRCIRRMKGAGTQRYIASLFGVSDRTIGKLHRGERWKHV